MKFSYLLFQKDYFLLGLFWAFFHNLLPLGIELDIKLRFCKTLSLSKINIIFFFYYKLNIAKAIPIEDISEALNTYKTNNTYKLITTNNLSYYLVGLLEGDSHISIPA